MSAYAATTPLPAGLFTMSLVEESTEAGNNNGYKAIAAVPPAVCPSVRLEIGDEFLTGISIDASQLGTGNSLKSFKGELNYSTTYFETVEEGNVTVIDPDVTDPAQIGVSSFYQYEATYDKLNNNKLNFSVKAARTRDPSGMLLVVKMRVKKAIDVSDSSISVQNFTATVTDSSDPLNPVDSDYTGTLELGMIGNSMSGHRQLLLQSEYGRDLGDLSIRQGKIITVPVYVKENTGFNDMEVHVEASDSFLVCKDVSLSAELNMYANFSEKTLPSATSTDKSSATVRVHALHDIPLEKGKELLEFKFEVPDTAVLGDKTVTIMVNSVTNESGTTMSGASGSVTRTINVLKKAVSDGDVNEDGVTNLIDAVFLLQYYNGARMLTEDQIIHGDMRSDGVITLVDVLMIMQDYNDRVTA